MSKNKIIKNLKTKHPKLNNSILENILENFVKSISDAILNKKSVEIRSFGTFFLKEIKEKKSARNPKTGELIYVPKKNKLRFRASNRLKKKLNN